MPTRFLTLADVAEELNVSISQARALVRSGELPAIKVGGRGQWRVEREQLEAYITKGYGDLGWTRIPQSDSINAPDPARRPS